MLIEISWPTKNSVWSELYAILIYSKIFIASLTFCTTFSVAFLRDNNHVECPSGSDTISIGTSLYSTVEANVFWRCGVSTFSQSLLCQQSLWYGLNFWLLIDGTWELLSVEYFSMISCALGSIGMEIWRCVFSHVSSESTSSKPIWIFCLEDVPSQHTLTHVTTENE
jgi:hypothetical protein